MFFYLRGSQSVTSSRLFAASEPWRLCSAPLTFGACWSQSAAPRTTPLSDEHLRNGVTGLPFLFQPAERNHFGVAAVLCNLRKWIKCIIESGCKLRRRLQGYESRRHLFFQTTETSLIVVWASNHVFGALIAFISVTWIMERIVIKEGKAESPELCRHAPAAVCANYTRATLSVRRLQRWRLHLGHRKKQPK